MTDYTNDFNKNLQEFSRILSQLNGLDLSISTDGLQKAMDGLEVGFEGTSKTISKSLGLMNDSIDVSSEFLAAARNNLYLQGVNGNYGDLSSAAGAFKNLTKKIFPKASPWIDLAGKIFNFDSGGIVPGSFSQPVPIVAHGSEMVLNPGQQATLFKMLNGQGAGGKSSQVYAPQIRSGVTASEVFEVLNRHNSQFFSMVAEGVQRNNSLRNAVRGA